MSDFKTKMQQIRFRLGLRPRPRWGSLQRAPRPPSRISGPISKGRRGEGKRGGKEREGKGRGLSIPRVNFLVTSLRRKSFSASWCRPTTQSKKPYTHTQRSIACVKTGVSTSNRLWDMINCVTFFFYFAMKDERVWHWKLQAYKQIHFCITLKILYEMEYLKSWIFSK